MSKRSDVVALPPSGGRGGAQPGHVWLIALAHSYRCEGTDPFGRVQFYARGHQDIAKGDSFLLKRWRRARTMIVSTRHCVRCAREMGAIKNFLRVLPARQRIRVGEAR
jgi:hypothetical protein